MKFCFDLGVFLNFPFLVLLFFFLKIHIFDFVVQKSKISQSLMEKIIGIHDRDFRFLLLKLWRSLHAFICRVPHQNRSTAVRDIRDLISNFQIKEICCEVVGRKQCEKPLDKVPVQEKEEKEVGSSQETEA